MHFRVALVALVVSACGPTSFKPFCEQTAVASCRQAFRCNADAVKAAFGSEADCVAKLQTQTRCDSFADEPCVLDGARTATCLSELENASCSTTPGTLPPSCNELTCAGPGIRCRRSSSSSDNGTCTGSRSECTDSNTYAVTCTGSSCACVKNGAEEKTFTGSCQSSGDEWEAVMKAECGYELN